MKFRSRTIFSDPRFYLVLLLLLTMVLHCKQEKLKPLILPSGGTINVIGVKKVKAVLSDGEIIFPKLEYESYIDIENPTELHKELREIWPLFLKDIEGSAVTFVQIAAFPVDSGMIKKSRITPFRKDETGIWRSPAFDNPSSESQSKEKKRNLKP